MAQKTDMKSLENNKFITTFDSDSVKFIGEGSFSWVLIAKNKLDKELYAIKIAKDKGNYTISINIV
jgi:hypothetical protein